MYDDTVAIHYAAYRPPIHDLILNSLLNESAIPRIGLDIGCGTGRSSQALKKYCHYVIGIDPSKDMLGRAEENEGVKYAVGSGEQIPVATNSINIVTIAGSLNYIDRVILIDELERVCLPDSDVVVYDFEIDLSYIEDHLALEISLCPVEYNHSANLCGFSKVEQVSENSDILPLKLNPSQISHILLSEKNRIRSLQSKYQELNVFDSLKQDVEAMDSVHAVKVKVYNSLYALK
jgi:ubiquinone/menaquinone biosynthesis C-methylase UbiE